MSEPHPETQGGGAVGPGRRKAQAPRETRHGDRERGAGGPAPGPSPTGLAINLGRTEASLHLGAAPEIFGDFRMGAGRCPPEGNQGGIARMTLTPVVGTPQLPPNLPPREGPRALWLLCSGPSQLWGLCPRLLS